jgi:hypothetical protein
LFSSQKSILGAKKWWGRKFAALTIFFMKCKKKKGSENLDFGEILNFWNFLENFTKKYCFTLFLIWPKSTIPFLPPHKYQNGPHRKQGLNFK